MKQTPPHPCPPRKPPPSNIYSTWVHPNTEHLIQAIDNARKWSPPPFSEPVFKFDWSDKSLQQNWSILESHNFNLQEIIMSDPLSPLFPGSEWKPTSLLQPIFYLHPLWPNVASQFSSGFLWPLSNIDEALQRSAAKCGILYGNHKSATSHCSKIIPSLLNETAKGWQLPIPISKLLNVPHLAVAPLGYVNQHGLDSSTGLPISKGRTTHDQSFVFPQCSNCPSVNDRLLQDQISPCEYGHTFLCHAHRLIHL